MGTGLSPNRSDRRGGGPRRLVPRTIRWRLALTYVGLILAVMVALGGYLAVLAREQYTDSLADQLAAQARLVGEIVAPQVEAGAGIAEIDPVVKRLGTQIEARLTIVDAAGVVLGDSAADPAAMENHAARPEVVAARRPGPGTGRSSRYSETVGEAALYVAVPIATDPPAVARVSLPLAEVDAAVGRVQRDVVVAALIAAALAAAAAIFVAGRITRPLTALRHHASAVAAGHLDVQVGPAETQELDELGRVFNRMTTELRTLVAEIDQARARLEAVLAALADGVVITDAEGIVVRINDAATRQLGCSPAEAIGRPFVAVSRDHELAGLLRAALAAPGARLLTVEHGLARRTLDAVAQGIVGGQQEQLGLVVLRDVTELRRLEAVRREFVANVSHELRTPLASIKALVETLEAGAVDDPVARPDFFGRIVHEVDRLAGLVDELLDLARLESGRLTLRLKPLDPAELARRGAERLRPQIERARLDLVLDAPEDLPRVLADGPRVEQVLLNLIHNAIKFTPVGGTITVAVDTGDDAKVRFAVRDTGVGVEPDALPRLFERFYKADKARRSDGTGLGLAIAKHIVQAHGGIIWAENRPGGGAVFGFTLPPAPAPTIQTVAAPDAFATVART